MTDRQKHRKTHDQWFQFVLVHGSRAQCNLNGNLARGREGGEGGERQRHRERERERERGRQTDRQTDRQTGRQTKTGKRRETTNNNVPLTFKQMRGKSKPEPTSTRTRRKKRRRLASRVTVEL